MSQDGRPDFSGARRLVETPGDVTIAFFTRTGITRELANQIEEFPLSDHKYAVVIYNEQRGEVQTVNLFEEDFPGAENMFVNRANQNGADESRSTVG